jgi:hypothetical protein
LFVEFLVAVPRADVVEPKVRTGERHECIAAARPIQNVGHACPEPPLIRLATK